MRQGAVGRALLRCSMVILAVVGAALATSTAGASSSTIAPATSPLAISLPQLLLGCDPVGRSIPAATVQVLSLVLPSAYMSSEHGTVAQADSFLVQAEVQDLSPLVVDYQIKTQARWSDGVAIGLADFLATWRDGAMGSGPAAAQYRLIQSISAPKDAHDVVVRFRRPTNAWQSLFSPLLPASASQSAMASCGAPTPTVDLSAGPSVIVQSSATSVLLSRNPSWWGSEPIFDPLEVTANPSLAPLALSSGSGLSYGQLSWFTPASLSAVSSVPQSSSSLDFSNRLLSLDFSVRGQTSMPQALRLGIAGLIDRAELVDSTAGLTIPSTDPGTSHLYSQGLNGYPSAANLPSLVAPSTTTTTGLTEAVPPLSSSASAQMAAAGFHRSGGRWETNTGRSLSLSLAVPADDHWAIDAGHELVQQLAGRGVPVNVELVPGSFDVAQLLREGKVQIGLVARTTDPFPADSAAWFTQLKGSPSSPVWSGFSSRAVNTLALAASQMMNAATAATLYQQIDQALWTAMPSLPLFTEPYLLAWSSQIAGISSTPYPPGTLIGLPTWKIELGG